MKCPICNKPSEVTDSRPTANDTRIRRRRTCFNGHRFTTMEMSIEDQALVDQLKEMQKTIDEMLTTLRRPRR